MVDTLVDLAKKVVNCLTPQAEKILLYLQNYDANLKQLKDEMQKLKDERMSIERRVSQAENNLENIDEKVQHWLDEATNIIDESTKVITDEETTNKRCFKGLCPNLISRYQLSVRAETKGKALVACREESPKDDRISYPTISEEIWLKSHKNYETLESRLSTLKSIRRALTDPNVSIIGVYGMGGTGKSTIVKEVAKQARQDKLFDQVVFSEVSQTIDIKKIQEEIANNFGLELDEEVEANRAKRLYDRLKKEKKILIILDNIWKHVDLESVGIPCGDDHKGCKILLTTRDRDVLLRMDSHDNFFIGALCVEEAWQLFKTSAGDDIEKRALKSTATDVVKACGGLPIALVTIGNALRSKSLPEWKNALRELQKPSTANFEGVSREAYKSIELSYRYLKDEQLKQTFLLCSQSESGLVMDLFKYGVGMSLFPEVNNMEDAHNKLDALIHKLIDSCLLLEGDSSGSFSMHDIVRDVAIIIACRDKNKNAFFVRNEDVRKWPDVGVLKKCSAIHLRGVSIHQLPERLECPQLEFLYITPKESLDEINIPPQFFTGMTKLRVIDFTRMKLFSLPSSIEFLENLQTLCLDQSKLGDITIIGKLKNLEVLSLVKSDILQLPKELGQLTQLRLLDLTDCFRLKVIAPGVLSSLTRLEELYMGNCFVEWEVDGPIGERSNASLTELVHLSCLTALEMTIRNDKALPKGFFERKLNRFKISIGDVSFSMPLQTDFGPALKFSEQGFLIPECETLRTLKLKLTSTTTSLQGPNNVEYLCLDKLQGVENVLFELDTEGFSQLKHLHVQHNDDLKCIIESMERAPFEPCPLLESLALYKLSNLERICNDQLSVQAFEELKIIKVNQCRALGNIFLLSSAKCLPKIQRIAVSFCIGLEVLFAIDGENEAIDEKIEFTELRTLCLGSLPKLVSFCGEVKTPNRKVLHQESMEINEISLEDKRYTSRTLFNDKVVLPNLEILEMYEMNVQKIWHDQLPVKFPQFQSLTRLVIWSCHNLKYIFSASMVQSLGQFQHLEIINSKCLREIISEEGADQVAIPSFVFPKLTTLNLIDLPELRCIYPGMHTFECPALKCLFVTGCHQLKKFTSESLSSEKSEDEEHQLQIPAQQQPHFLFEKIFTNLEELGVDGISITTILHQGNFPQHFFDRLKVLSVVRDGTYGFPLHLLDRFQNLEELSLISNSYREILSNDEGLAVKHFGKKQARIKLLDLQFLYYLKQLWKRDSGMDAIFQYLETLRVKECLNLSILIPPSSVSFRNLTELEAFSCQGLKNLVTSSTAKGLKGLINMKIYRCYAMTEVIQSEGNNEGSKEEIAFSKLKMLILSNLNSLTSFCHGDYMFRFPSLKDLIVIDCPNMSIFTNGELITPPRVDVWCNEEYEGFSHWEGDLNKTIQSLHKREPLEGSSSYSTEN